MEREPESKGGGKSSGGGKREGGHPSPGGNREKKGKNYAASQLGGNRELSKH